jgi:hypothetical protein
MFPVNSRDKRVFYVRRPHSVSSFISARIIAAAPQKMKPPIFSARPDGSKPQQYLHRARQFRQAAENLPDYSNSEQFWPKYALLTHAIELALKAFAGYSIASGQPAGKLPKQHDLLGWYRLAIQYGLVEDRIVTENLKILNELHLTHYTRYPQDPARPIPDASIIADSTVDDLIFTFTQFINPR